jgi:hypothetical protein
VLGTDDTEGDAENGTEVMLGYDGTELKSEAIADDGTEVKSEAIDGCVDIGGVGFVLRTTSVHAPVVYPNLMNTPESSQSNVFNTTPPTVTTKFPSASIENTCVKELIGRETSRLFDTVTKLT